MTDPEPLDLVHEHYALGLERDRLATPFGQVEFARTTELLLRGLPRPPARVADVGGGPGRYSLWLGELGYTVVHRDPVALHVEQLTSAAGRLGDGIESALGDARELDLDDASVDAVLLLGPLYHLRRRADRLQALREARRVAVPGGQVFAAAISRWAPRLHGGLVERLGDRYPSLPSQLEQVERTGRLEPLFPGSFSGYCHTPRGLRSEVRAAGLELVDLVSVEGIAFALPDLEQRLADPQARRLVLETARALERVPELLGIGPHLLATARRRRD
jgi:SAM-dependent methyltransferase